MVSLAELRVGALAAVTASRRRDVTQWIEGEIMNSFAGRVLPVGLDVLVEWLQLGRKMSAKGKTRAPPDLIIAATARLNDLIVVSRNARDFANTGVVVYDPWSGQTHKMEDP